MPDYEDLVLSYCILKLNLSTSSFQTVMRYYNRCQVKSLLKTVKTWIFKLMHSLFFIFNKRNEEIKLGKSVNN